MPRLAAAFISLLAWAGLAIQFQSTLAQSGSVPDTIFILLRFFTVLTNLLVALTFTAIALGRNVPPFWLGGVTLAIALVGVVFWLLLRGLLDLSGGARVADMLLHMAVPLLVPVYWLAFAMKGALRWRDPMLWSLYPLAYLVYALVRGQWEGRYAYPFIDVGALGLAQTIANSFAIAVGFVGAGLLLVAGDARLARARHRTTQ